MPYAASILVALWLGSLVHLVLSVSTLFAKFPKLQSDVAIEGAPAIFHVTERYHIALAVLSIVIVIVWQRLTRVAVLKSVVALLGLAAILATLQIALISPRMDAARVAEQRQTFDRLHRLSTTEYLAQTALVFTAALLLPAAIRQAGSRDTTPVAIRD